MSIHPRKAGGWDVRWREGGSHRSRKFDRKRDAETFDARVRQAHQRGEGVVVSTRTLDELVAEWAPRKARTLEPKTANWYARLYDDHVGPYLGGLKLTELRPNVLTEWQEERLAAGAGPTAMRRAAMLLSQILDDAVWRELIPTNFAARLPRPKDRPSRTPVVVSPEEVERMRAQLFEAGRHRDATLVSVMAYAGLHPGEALGLEWRHFGRRTLLVEQRNTDSGVRESTKTARNRPVKLLEPLAADLAEWKLASGGRDSAPVFPRRDGKPWNLPTDLANWRRRVWNKVAPEGVTPYALRGSYASLLIHAGRSPSRWPLSLGTAWR